MDTHWDPRFFFSAWDDGLVRKLQQQEDLKRRGLTREVLIIIDDVILDGPARSSLENMAMRGRHFRVSLACCAVSYVSLPKPVRRSLDCLLLFSCPMAGDLKVLTWEYARRAEMARFALDNLQPYECLVLETLERKQELCNWRARNITLESLRSGGFRRPRPRLPGEVVGGPVQRPAPGRQVVRQLRALELPAAARLQTHQLLIRTRPGYREVVEQVPDQLGLGPDAGVADPGVQEHLAVEVAQQVDQVGLADQVEQVGHVVVVPLLSRSSHI